MSKKTDLIKNTLIIALGRVSTQLITFFLLPLYTIYLSPADYGTVDLIISYVALLVPVITVQLEMGAFRFLVDARGNEAEKKRVISNVVQMVAGVSVLFIGAFLLLGCFVDVKYSSLLLLIICITMFSSLFLQIARGVGDNQKFAIASIVTGVATLAMTVVFVMCMHLGAQGVLLSIALANLACAIYLALSLRLYKYIDLGAQDRKLQKSLAKYSLPLVPNGISWWVIVVSDRTIISVMIDVAANGIYAVANKFAAIFSSVFAIFFMSWTESASVHVGAHDRDQFFSETLNASFKFFGSLGLVLIAYVSLAFPLLIDANFGEAYLYIPILIVGAFFNAIVSLYGAIYIAKKMTKQVANTSVIAAVINITFTVVLIRFIGIYAAALATAVAFLSMAIYRHYDVKKYVHITYPKYTFAKMAALYVFVTTLYYFNNIFGNIANVVVATIIATVLNKSIIRIIRDKIFKRLKKLTPEQEIYEDSI